MASGAAAAAPAVQTVVLRVSIHCHGCKKKVRKVLRSVEGVQSVTVDAAQHKVTVTGTVSADALVQRLHKSGKKGVPWQYCQPPAKTEAAPAPAPAPAPASEALPAPPAQPAGDGGKDAAPAASAADKKPEEAAKEPQAEDSEKKKKPEQEEKKPEAESKGEEKVEAKKGGGDSEAAEPKAKTAEPAAKQEAKEAAAKDEGEPKKDEKPKDAGKPEPAAVTSERSLPAPPPPKHAYEEQFRQPYYAPQPVLSYHAAQPSASVSYFASHPQPQPAYSMQPQQQAYSMQQQQAYSMQQQPMKQWSPSYLYMPYPHAAPEPYYQDYYSPPGMHASPPPMQDSYRIFDDENPNSCSVM